MYIVEVVEKSKVLSEECIVDSFERGLHLSSDESVDVLSRKVVGIFRDRDRAEKCVVVYNLSSLKIVRVGNLKL